MRKQAEMSVVAVALSTKIFLYKHCIDSPLSMAGEQQQWIFQKKRLAADSSSPLYNAMHCLPLTQAARHKRIPSASGKRIFLIHIETIPRECSVWRGWGPGHAEHVSLRHQPSVMSTHSGLIGAAGSHSWVFSWFTSYCLALVPLARWNPSVHPLPRVSLRVPRGQDTWASLVLPDLGQHSLSGRHFCTCLVLRNSSWGYRKMVLEQQLREVLSDKELFVVLLWGLYVALSTSDSLWRK